MQTNGAKQSSLVWLRQLAARIYERSDSDVRGLEGLEPTTGWIYGEAPNRPLVIEENGIKLAIDIAGGHKTGFYLDQRENRALLGQLAVGKDVLNCFVTPAVFSSSFGGKRGECFVD